MKTFHVGILICFFIFSMALAKGDPVHINDEPSFDDYEEDFMTNSTAAMEFNRKTCMGTNGDWCCCTDGSPCNIGEGDCDRDSHCAAGLRCSDTANNCIKDFNPNAHPLADCCIAGNLKIRLGEHDLNIIDETMVTKDFDIDLIVKAPNFNSPYFASNDIALIRLASHADISIYTPICLPSHLQDFTGQTSTLAGWGRTAEGGTSANILQELEGLPIISDSQCQSAYANVGAKVSSEMLCAGGEEGKNACNGDSGGPLMIHCGHSSRFTLAGVVSWGYGCAREGFPGVYAEVSKFIPWIEDTIKNNGGRGETCAA